MRSIFGNVLLSVFICVLLTACSSGTAVVTGTKRERISSNDVILYHSAPPSYEVVGFIEASDDTGWTPAGSLENAIAELKNQAAKLGANGVLLEDTGTINSTVMGTPWITKTASGRAIHVFQGEPNPQISVIPQPPAKPQRAIAPSSINSAPTKRKWKKPVQ